MNEFISYVGTNYEYILYQFGRHFLISLYGVLMAVIVGVPLGFFIARRKKLAQVILSLSNVIQTVSALAMLTLLMGWFGLGVNTVIYTVFLYSLLPIVSNTYTGVLNVDPNIVDVSKALGMKDIQIMLKVELPLSLSIIIGGIRNAFVVAVGIAAVGTFIGAGGLGDIISRGINVTNGSAIIWAGALPTAIMAVGVDTLLGYVEKKFVH